MFSNMLFILYNIFFINSSLYFNLLILNLTLPKLVMQFVLANIITIFLNLYIKAIILAKNLVFS